MSDTAAPNQEETNAAATGAASQVGPIQIQ